MSGRAARSGTRKGKPIVRGFRDKTVRKARGEAWQGKPKADPSQNLHVERGRPISLDEVRAYALDGHAACRSRPGLGKDGRPCHCANLRFFKQYPEVIVDSIGMAWWPKTTAE